MRVIREEWPYGGRVGVCRATECAGQRLLLIPDTRPGTWLLYLEPPFENFRLGDDVFASFDEYLSDDSTAQAISDEWDVAWLPEGPEEEELERSLFNMRRELIKNRALRRRRRLRAWTRPIRTLLGRGSSER